MGVRLAALALEVGAERRVLHAGEAHALVDGAGVLDGGVAVAGHVDDGRVGLNLRDEPPVVAVPLLRGVDGIWDGMVAEHQDGQARAVGLAVALAEDEAPLYVGAEGAAREDGVELVVLSDRFADMSRRNKSGFRGSAGSQRPVVGG
jgi:hypothetical protein